MIDYTKAFSQVQQKGYDEGLRNYMLKIYNYMAIALVITGVAGFSVLNFAPLRNLMFQTDGYGHYGTTGIGMLISLSPIGIYFYFAANINKITVQTAQTLFWVYAALIGMSLSYLGIIYTGESIARTFFICASVFGAMSIYGYSTQKDLTSIGSFMVMGLMGLIAASVFNIFLQSSAINFATSLIGIVVFMGLIAWDTQKLKNIYYASGGGELGQKMSVMGALNLYMDFINLFVYMLRFFGNRRND